MANATIIASAVAVLVVIAAVVAIAINLTKTNADGSTSKLLDIPSSYTANFNVVWRNGVGNNQPSGWTTTGTVSVAGAAMDFKVTNSKAGEPDAVTTYTGGHLYGGNICIDVASSGFDYPALQAIDVNGASSHATAVPAPDASEFWACAGGSTYSISAFAADHLLCVVGGKLKWAAGVSYKMTMTTFAAVATEIAAPAGADMTNCQAAGRRLAADEAALHIKPELKAAAETAWFHPEARDTHARKLLANSQKSVCFVHGMGGDANAGANADYPTNANMAGNGAAYWGDLAAQLGLPAGNIHAIAVDTTARGWNNLADYTISTNLQDVYYNYILYYRCDVVFAHSMGNTILAALGGRPGKAIRWYESQGPLRGSTSARLADQICSSGAYNTAAYAAQLLGVGAACKTVSMGYCAGSVSFGFPPSGCSGRASVKSLAASPASCSGTACMFVNGASMRSDAPTDAAFKANILGRMCGTSAYGSGGFKGVGLAAIALLGGYVSPSDGMVEMATCAPLGNDQGQGFGGVTDILYAISGNHQDGTGLTGDTAWGSRMPITWIHNMITRGSLGACPIAGQCSNPGASTNSGVDTISAVFCSANGNECQNVLGGCQDGFFWGRDMNCYSCSSNTCVSWSGYHDNGGNCRCGHMGGYCSGASCTCPFSHGTFCDRCWDLTPTCTGGWTWYGWCRNWQYLDHSC